MGDKRASFEFVVPDMKKIYLIHICIGSWKSSSLTTVALKIRITISLQIQSKGAWYNSKSCCNIGENLIEVHYIYFSDQTTELT